MKPRQTIWMIQTRQILLAISKNVYFRYRRLLSVSLWLVWGFSGSLGVWQALVHNVGPHRLVTTYFLCGAQVE
jgi:hypothetical protein